MWSFSIEKVESEVGRTWLTWCRPERSWMYVYISDDRYQRPTGSDEKTGGCGHLWVVTWLLTHRWSLNPVEDCCLWHWMIPSFAFFKESVRNSAAVLSSDAKMIGRKPLVLVVFAWLSWAVWRKLISIGLCFVIVNKTKYYDCALQSQSLGISLSCGSLHCADLWDDYSTIKNQIKR